MAAATLVVAAVAVGGYVVAQYEFARQPSSLSTLPEYPFAGSTYPIDDIPAPERDHAEAVLRHFAAGVAPGYRPTAERFLASKGEFIWNAVRSSLDGYLSDASFHVKDVGQLPHKDGDPAYVVWARINQLQHWFNPKQILAVGLQDTVRAAQPREEIHVYAYFELTPAAPRTRHAS